MNVKIEQNIVNEFGVEKQTFSILSDQAMIIISFEISGNKVKVI